VPVGVRHAGASEERDGQAGAQRPPSTSSQEGHGIGTPSIGVSMPFTSSFLRQPTTLMDGEDGYPSFAKY
jgi:hypothetical protein